MAQGYQSHRQTVLVKIDISENHYRRNCLTTRLKGGWSSEGGFQSGRKLGGTCITEEIFHEQIFERDISAAAQIVLHNSAPILIVTTVVKTDNEQDNEPREGDKVEGKTVAEDTYEVPRLIRVGRQTKIPPDLEDVVLVTTEARRLVQFDTLPDGDFMYARKSANSIMDLFP